MNGYNERTGPLPEDYVSGLEREAERLRRKVERLESQTRSLTAAASRGESWKQAAQEYLAALNSTSADRQRQALNNLEALDQIPF